MPARAEEGDHFRSPLPPGPQVRPAVVLGELAHVVRVVQAHAVDHDLAVGVHQETVDDVFFAGALQIIYGSNGGLTEIGNQFWTQDSPGILDSAEQGDTFGHAVAAGDFNNDGWGDLAVGVLSEDIDRIANAGAVQVLYGLAPAIFADGFESADTSAWSSTQ